MSRLRSGWWKHRYGTSFSHRREEQRWTMIAISKRCCLTHACEQSFRNASLNVRSTNALDGFMRMILGLLLLSTMVAMAKVKPECKDAADCVSLGDCCGGSCKAIPKSQAVKERQRCATVACPPNSQTPPPPCADAICVDGQCRLADACNRDSDCVVVRVSSCCSGECIAIPRSQKKKHEDADRQECAISDCAPVTLSANCRGSAVCRDQHCQIRSP